MWSTFARRRRGAALLPAVLLVLGAGASERSTTHVLLIGIDSYPHVRPLYGAVNDVQAVRRLLTEDLKVPAASIRLLVNEQATKQAVLGALSDLAQRTRPGDAVFIYYSGHGWLVADQDGDESTFNEDERYDEALVPYDATPWPKERAYEPNPTLLTDDELARALGPMPGRRVAVIFDSCHSGNGLRGLPGTEVGRSLYTDAPIPPSRFRSLTPRVPSMDVGGQVVFIAAARWRETASDLGEFEGRRHGALTASLLRSISKAGPGWAKVLSWESLFRQAREDLLSQGIASQTPTIVGAPLMGRAPVAQFFDAPASTNIAELSAPQAFDVYLESNQYQFLVGDEMRLAIESERSGYLYVFDIDAERKVTQLFPNQFENDNALPASTQVKIPGAASRYRFTADQPYGTSTIVALVTLKPWDDHARLKLPQSLVPLSTAQEGGLRDILLELVGGAQAASSEWAWQKVTVEVVAGRDDQEAPAAQPAPVGGPAAPLRPPASAQAPAPTAPTAPAQQAQPALPAPVTPAPTPSGAATAPAKAALTGRAASLDDRDVTWEEQQDLPTLRPALFRYYEQLAERYAPVFWQDVSGESDGKFRPWKDFFVRYDFDQTSAGPNWPAPPGFQDETKRQRLRSLDVWLDGDARLIVVENEQNPGVFRITDNQTRETTTLDLRPYVYWAVLATPTHYFLHYAAFKAEDWKAAFGHPGDLEGNTVIVDRKTERVVALLALAHDDVRVTRGLDGENESNIEVLVDPSLATRDLSADDTRPINGALRMEATRAGEAAPKEHQDVYSETRGHGQYGPSKIVPRRYIVYAGFLPEDTWRAPSFNRSDYVVSNAFADVRTKYKYRLIYVGSGRDDSARPEEKTLWGEYRDLLRFPGGVNPPWCWRDNLFFRTGWWKDPRTVLKVGEARYLVNPYRQQGGSR